MRVREIEAKGDEMKPARTIFTETVAKKSISPPTNGVGTVPPPRGRFRRDGDVVPGGSGDARGLLRVRGGDVDVEGVRRGERLDERGESRGGDAVVVHDEDVRPRFAPGVILHDAHPPRGVLVRDGRVDARESDASARGPSVARGVCGAARALRGSGVDARARRRRAVARAGRERAGGDCPRASRAGREGTRVPRESGARARTLERRSARLDPASSPRQIRRSREKSIESSPTAKNQSPRNSVDRGECFQSSEEMLFIAAFVIISPSKDWKNLDANRRT